MAAFLFGVREKDFASKAVCNVAVDKCAEREKGAFVFRPLGCLAASLLLLMVTVSGFSEALAQTVSGQDNVAGLAAHGGTTSADNILQTNGDGIKNSGNDTLDGGEGNDTLTGRAGDDIFVFASGHGDDTITDFTDDEDVIDLAQISGISGFGDLEVTAMDDATMIDLTAHGGGTILLENFDIADLDASDFWF